MDILPPESRPHRYGCCSRRWYKSALLVALLFLTLLGAAAAAINVFLPISVDQQRVAAWMLLVLTCTTVVVAVLNAALHWRRLHVKARTQRQFEQLQEEGHEDWVRGEMVPMENGDAVEL